MTDSNRKDCCRSAACKPYILPKAVERFPYNMGNPVFNCATDIKKELPVPALTEEECLAGYPDKPVNILYRTTSASYGSRPPSFHTAPSTYWPKSCHFSNHLRACGMPRCTSLNTALDKTRF